MKKLRTLIFSICLIVLASSLILAQEEEGPGETQCKVTLLTCHIIKYGSTEIKIPGTEVVQQQ